MLFSQKIMRDGLYRIEKPYLCAGFVIKNNKVVARTNSKKENKLLENNCYIDLFIA